MSFIAAFDAGLTGLVYDLRLPDRRRQPALLARGRRCVAYRLGWFAAARRHPGRAALLASPSWSFALPVGLLHALAAVHPIDAGRGRARGPRRRSRRSSPSASTDGDRQPRADALRRPHPHAATPTADADPHADPVHAHRCRRPASSPAPTTSTSDPARRRSSSLRPGVYTLRLEDFSVRNGPDLFVYLSPDAAGYTDDALELGRLKATDGSFNYELPPGTDPADVRQRDHLVQAVRPPLRGRAVRRRLRVRADGPSSVRPAWIRGYATLERARTIPPENAADGSVAV